MAELAQFVVKNQPGPLRLDRALREHFPQWGRNAVQQVIGARQVQVNGKVVWLASWQVQNNDRIVVAAPPAAKPVAAAHFEDQWLLADEADLVAVNKPAGLLAEPTRWGTGVNLRDLAVARFGPLTLFHRLDRDTSGVILLTRSRATNQYLDIAFKTHTVRKGYVAVIPRTPGLAASGVINTLLAPDPQRRDRMVVVNRSGERAITHYTLGALLGDHQIVQLWPQTGRTHQLRVHLAHLGAPIVGDRLYGGAMHERLLLHAHTLELPAAEGFPARHYVAPLPPSFNG